MKLLFLNTNIGYGGAEKMLVWVANQCANAGHDVTLLTYRDCIRIQYVSDKVKYVHQQLEDSNGKGNIFKSIAWLHKYVKEECFGLAIAFLSPSQLRLYFACIGTNTKILFSHRGDPYFKGNHLKTLKILKAYFVSRLNHWAFTHANAYVFQTHQVLEYYNKKIQSKSVVIPNPVHPLKRSENREGNITCRIVNVARLDIPQKRQDVLIDAFKIICKDYPNYVLEFYGDGAGEEILKNMAKDCPQIRFMGKTSNVAEVIQNATMFVLSSDFEGIPNALLEAMSLGLPCVSTDCSPGGAALLVQNQINGLLTKRSDVDDLAKAMKFILDNPTQAEAMGKEASKVINTFSEKKIREQWLQIIEQI